MATTLPFYGTGVNPFAGAAPAPATDGPLPVQLVTWSSNTTLAASVLYTYQVATVSAAGVILTLPAASGLSNGAWFVVRPLTNDLTLSTGGLLAAGSTATFMAVGNAWQQL